MEYPSITSTAPAASAWYFTAGASGRTAAGRRPYARASPGSPSGRPMKSEVKPAARRGAARARSLIVVRRSWRAVSRRTAIA